MTTALATPTSVMPAEAGTHDTLQRGCALRDVAPVDVCVDGRRSSGAWLRQDAAMTDWVRWKARPDDREARHRRSFTVMLAEAGTHDTLQHGWVLGSVALVDACVDGRLRGHDGEKQRRKMKDESDWAALFCSDADWNEKKQKIIAELNNSYGDEFASLYGGDWIKLEAHGQVLFFQERVRNGKFLGAYRLQHEAKFIGTSDGESVKCDKLIHHIGSFGNIRAAG